MADTAETPRVREARGRLARIADDMKDAAGGTAVRYTPPTIPPSRGRADVAGEGFAELAWRLEQVVGRSRTLRFLVSPRRQPVDILREETIGGVRLDLEREEFRGDAAQLRDAWLWLHYRPLLSPAPSAAEIHGRSRESKRPGSR
jgi:hypothetical protein